MSKSKDQQPYSLDHCRHDVVTCLAPGLFRMVHKGTRSDVPLNVRYDFQEGWSIEYSAPALLGPDDLVVLQGLVALAGPSGKEVSYSTSSEDGIALRELMEMRGVPSGDTPLVVESTFRGLAREIGMSEGGRVLQHIRDSVERLWKVSIIVQDPGKRRVGFRLLSFVATDDKRLKVALNPRISAAVLGTIRYTRISMSEIRRLKSDAARLLHQRLSAWIDNDKGSRRVNLDKMCEYIWADHASKSAETQRQHRWKCKQAIDEIASVGWHFREYAIRKYEITRPCHARTN